MDDSVKKYKRGENNARKKVFINCAILITKKSKETINLPHTDNHYADKQMR